MSTKGLKLAPMEAAEETWMRSLERKRKPKTCHDCGAEPGDVHDDGCDVERCSVCGGQRLGCDCRGHEPWREPWLGVWPGDLEARLLGLYCVWKDGSRGWEECTPEALNAVPDMNRWVSWWLGGGKDSPVGQMFKIGNAMIAMAWAFRRIADA